MKQVLMSIALGGMIVTMSACGSTATTPVDNGAVVNVTEANAADIMTMEAANDASADAAMDNMSDATTNGGDRENSGDRNSGDRNSGDRNSGDRNSGDRNSGDR